MAEKKKKCKYPKYDGKPCGRDLYDEKHCIFHSEDIEGKKEGFEGKFWKEFERQEKEEKIYDFTGFIFPDSISFKKRKFNKCTVFNHVRFLYGVRFNESKFSGEKTYFINAKFKNKTDFSGAIFKGKIVSFYKAIFLGDVANFCVTEFLNGTCYFGEVRFYSKLTFFYYSKFLGNSVGFYKAIFKNETTFYGSIFKGKETDFRNSNFLSESLDFTECQFMSERTDFSKALFKDKSIGFSNSYFENIFGFDSFFYRLKYFKKLKYRFNDFKFYIGEKSSKRYPITGRKIKDAWYLEEFKGQHPIIHALWNVTSKCGQSIWRWTLWSFGFALYFALNFYLIYYSFPHLFEFKTKLIEYSAPTIWSFIYYSIVTFTTLGFGDIVPAAEWVQRWVMAEVILGYIMLGGLISIFANKLARRS